VARSPDHATAATEGLRHSLARHGGSLADEYRRMETFGRASGAVRRPRHNEDQFEQGGDVWRCCYCWWDGLRPV